MRRTSTSEAYLTQIRFEPGAGSKCIKRMERVYRVPYDMYLKPLYSLLLERSSIYTHWCRFSNRI